MTRVRSNPGAGAPPGRAASKTPTAFVGRYQILEKAGEGGMGSLYLARDPAIDRLLAVKVLRHGFDSPELRERFSREARAAGRLRHPNIVTIFDVGEHDGNPFIAMEFLAGETLDELIRQRARLSLARRLKLIEELCDGLAYAHRAGIVHRDIKPANLMVDSEGVLKILDFGIVRLEESGSTQDGVLVGSVNYMSPEQITGSSSVDHRGDIFAVGLVGYELLTLRQAFPGTLKDGLFNRILTGDFEPLRTVLSELDPSVATIVEQAMRIDPADRYQDLARMRNDLMRVRQRIEADEEQAVYRFGGDSGETLIATAPVPTPLPTPKPAPVSTPSLEAAERELASGNFRAALTLAGRSAAEAPHDASASQIMARAQAALLERGRSMERSTAPPSTAVPAPPAGSPPASWRSPLPLAAGAAVLSALLVAAAFLAMGRSPAPDTFPAAPDQRATGTVVKAPESDVASRETAGAADPPAPDSPVTAGTPDPAKRAGAATPAREAARPPASPAALPASGSPAPASPRRENAPAILRVGRDDVAAPRRIGYVEPEYPPGALASRARGTVRLDLTIGRNGRVADVQVTSSVGPEFDRSAVEAARKWEFAPTLVNGEAVAVIYPVTVEFSPPPAAETRAQAVPPPEIAKPSPPPPPPPGSSAGNGAATSPPPAAEVTAAPAAPPVQGGNTQADTTAVRDLLRRYERAWEARDPDAVSRLHALSADELAQVRATLAGAVEYGMTIEVRTVSVDQRRATVLCSITRTFRPRTGSRQQRTVESTIMLEKRGDAWIIVAIDA